MAYKGYSMMLAILISILDFCKSGIWCGNNECTFCLNGYSFESSMCIAQCPTDYLVSESPKKCDRYGSMYIIDIDLANPYNFNTSTIGGFSSVDGQPFLSNPQVSPIITKDRGLFFNETSQLISNQDGCFLHLLEYHTSSEFLNRDKFLKFCTKT